MARWLASFSAASFLCATVAWNPGARGEDPAQGKDLYEQHCTLCHGADGKGNGPAAASLSPPPKDFTNPQFWSGDVDEKISKTIRNGHGPMPAFKMSKSEIDAIIDYMKKSFKE